MVGKCLGRIPHLGGARFRHRGRCGGRSFVIGERNVMWVLGTGQCGHKEKMEKIKRRNKEKDGELKFMFVFKE